MNVPDAILLQAIGAAPGRSSLAGGTSSPSVAMVVAGAPAGRSLSCGGGFPHPSNGGVSMPATDTRALSYRDEQIVIWHRAGLSEHQIARSLGHETVLVIRVLNRAARMGIPTTSSRPAHAAEAAPVCPAGGSRTAGACPISPGERA